MSRGREAVSFGMKSSCNRDLCKCAWSATLVAVALVFAAHPRTSPAQDVSSPAILQMFEAQVGHDRRPHGGHFRSRLRADVAAAAAAGGWRRAYRSGTICSTASISASRETKHFTAPKRRSRRASLPAHGASVKMYTDFIPNHNGFRNKNTASFVAQGGYPGFRALDARATRSATFTIRRSATRPIRSTAACSA